MKRRKKRDSKRRHQKKKVKNGQGITEGTKIGLEECVTLILLSKRAVWN
jgi:hypothetical protein